jgi:hypothetical protein
VSRRHAEIWLSESGVLMMADEGSSNGTTLIRGGRGFPLLTEALSPSDRVRFGEVELGVKDLVDAVEIKHPGALTAAPAPGHPPPLPEPVLGAMPPALVPCECGGFKSIGYTCPVCGR